jgi:hypothetical protein
MPRTPRVPTAPNKQLFPGQRPCNAGSHGRDATFGERGDRAGRFRIQEPSGFGLPRRSRIPEVERFSDAGAATLENVGHDSVLDGHGMPGGFDGLWREERENLAARSG